MSTGPVVFLVDDDDALRRATKRLLDAHGFTVRAFASAEEFLEVYDPDTAGCLLLDLRLPGRSGLELQRSLAEADADVPIVFLTGHADVPTSVDAMKRGAIDFLEKPVKEAELLAGIARALERDAQARASRAEVDVVARRFARLTPREREVFGYIVQGNLNKQAAFALGIAVRTVKLHRARVLEKMRAGSVADLVRMDGLLRGRPVAGGDST